MKNLCIGAALALALCGCAKPSAEPVKVTPRTDAHTDVAPLLRGKLVLRTVDGACRLETLGLHPERQIPLRPAPPCSFVRNKDGGLQTYSYPDAKVDSVLLVVGKPVSDEERRHWVLPQEPSCGSETQGVIVRGESLEPANTLLTGLPVCTRTGVDEKVFWQAAHDAR